MSEIDELKFRIQDLERDIKTARELDRIDRACCERVLTELSGIGVCTPEETYGSNTSWAIDDLLRAVKDKHQEILRLQFAIKSASNKLNESAAPFDEGCSILIDALKCPPN